MGLKASICACKIVYHIRFWTRFPCLSVGKGSVCALSLCFQPVSSNDCLRWSDESYLASVFNESLFQKILIPNCNDDESSTTATFAWRPTPVRIANTSILSE